MDALIRKLRKQERGPAQGKIEVEKWHNWMSFDIIDVLSFGQTFHCLETQTHHPWVEMIFGNLKGLSLMGRLQPLHGTTTLATKIDPLMHRLYD